MECKSNLSVKTQNKYTPSLFFIPCLGNNLTSNVLVVGGGGCGVDSFIPRSFYSIRK